MPLAFPPRLLRLRIAPAYLGINKNVFNKLVRPCVRVITIGKRGIAFDRLELDAWAEEYCRRNGRPAPEKEGQLCRSEHQDSTEGPRRGARNGTSTNGSNTMDGLCESTGTDDEEEAQRYLEKRVREIREAVVFGVRRKRTFRKAATKYLTDYAHKPSIGRSALALKDMDAFIGDKWLGSVHGESFRPYIEARRATGASSKRGRKKRKPLSMSTLNRNIGVARRVLRLAATVWREADSNLTWLAAAPLLQLESDPTPRKAYPLDWEEQQLLFSELTPHLQRMALFDVNTGLRDQELCNLQWSWEQRVPELDTPEIKRSVFVLPSTSVKNRQARAVILNDVAQSVLEEVRGEHPVYVFTWEDRKGQRNRVGHFRNSGWIQAR
jgi:integrase